MAGPPHVEITREAIVHFTNKITEAERNIRILDSQIRDSQEDYEYLLQRRDRNYLASQQELQRYRQERQHCVNLLTEYRAQKEARERELSYLRLVGE